MDDGEGGPPELAGEGVARDQEERVEGARDGGEGRGDRVEAAGGRDGGAARRKIGIDERREERGDPLPGAMRVRVAAAREREGEIDGEGRGLGLRGGQRLGLLVGPRGLLGWVLFSLSSLIFSFGRKIGRK